MFKSETTEATPNCSTPTSSRVASPSGMQIDLTSIAESHPRCYKTKSRFWEPQRASSLRKRHQCSSFLLLSKNSSLSVSVNAMDGASQQSQLDLKLRQYQALVEVAESIAAHRDLPSLLKVRLIAATNSNLEQMVADQKCRSDLYYRLNIFPVTIARHFSQRQHGFGRAVFHAGAERNLRKESAEVSGNETITARFPATGIPPVWITYRPSSCTR
jgi:hypothetical protein